MKTLNNRTAEHDIDDQFLKRWSPRAMSGETISQEKLMTLFEAARWAPSANNLQPWRFIFAQHGDEHFEKFLSFMTPNNQGWAKDAAVVVVTISDTLLADGKPSLTHSFDAGAAWENLALQGQSLGLVIHGMGGFDREVARAALGIPEKYKVEMMIVIGMPGDVKNLPEALQARETPSGRRELDKTVFKGQFKEDVSGLNKV